MQAFVEVALVDEAPSFVDDYKRVDDPRPFSWGRGEFRGLGGLTWLIVRRLELGFEIRGGRWPTELFSSVDRVLLPYPYAVEFKGIP